MSSRIAACLKPPAITELDSSEGLPPWILFDTRVYLDRREDSTTATTQTSKGQDIHVSICFANPPALSYVCIYFPDLKEVNFAGEPRLVRSEKQFLLLHLPLKGSATRCVRRSSEYYMYEAIPGKPKLSLIPHPADSLLMPQDIGIYCCNDGRYLLAGLCPTPDLEGYELNLYSPGSVSWTSKPACFDNPPIDKHHPALAHKVILLGGSLLAWVDLWKGMLVCDVLYDDPIEGPLDDPLNHPVPVWFIPLPDLLPGNQEEHVCPWMVRDVTCTNGSLKLIEIELLTVQNVVKESMVTSDDLCYDDKIPPRKLVGWRSVIWNRVLSDKGWRMGCEVRADDILVVNPSHSALFAQLGNDVVGHSTLLSVLPSYPTLSIHGDDVVHMNCSLRLDIDKAWMISIDMANKAVQTLEPCLPGELGAYCPHFPCVLSNHLTDTTALPQAVQVSNSKNITDDQRLRSCAQEATSVPNHFDPPLVPQQSFGLLDAVTSYNQSPYEHADYIQPSYDNSQWSLALQQQPAYLPNWLNIPSWFSSRSVNADPAYPVFNTAALGQMVYPSQAVPLNSCHLFRPLSQAGVLPWSSPFPSIPYAVAGHPVPGTRRTRPHRRSPYDRSNQMTRPDNEFLY